MNDPSMLRTMLTGKDNFSIDVGRVLLCLLVLAYIALAVFDELTKGPFNPMAFGGGAATLLTGAGILMKWKAGTEPGA